MRNLKTQLNARNCKVIIAALRGFGCAISLIGNPYLGKSYSVNLNHAYEELQDLVERVAIKPELMNVAIKVNSRSNFRQINSTSNHAPISTSWTISGKTKNNAPTQTKTPQP